MLMLRWLILLVGFAIAYRVVRLRLEDRRLARMRAGAFYGISSGTDHV